MRNVAGRLSKLALLTALALASAACSKTPVDVSSLGLKLSAPQLKTNPFDQDIDTQGFVEVAGSCSEISGLVYVSMDGNSWYGIPDTTTYTIGGVTSTKTNDTDCSDNSFSFFLTIDLASSWVGHAITKDDITQLFFRTEGIMGESEQVVINDGNNNPGPPNPSVITLILSKDYPSGFAGSNHCEQIIAGLYDDQGRSASVSTPTPFTINRNGTNTVTYPTYNDCATGTNASPTENIPAYQSSVRTYVRFSGTGSVPLKISTTSSDVQYSSTAQNFPLRNLTAQQFIAFEDAPFRIYKQKCYPITMKMHHYDGSDYSGSFDFDLTSSSSDLKFYSDSLCNTDQTTFTVSSSPSLTIYARYNSSTSGADYPAFTMTATPNAAAGVDPTTRRIEIDQSANSTVTQYSWQGPTSINTGQCQPYDLVSKNSNGTALPMTTGKTFTLAVTSSSGNFYYDASCSSTISSLLLYTQSYQQRIYFKPTTSVAGTYNISGISGSDTPAYSLNVTPSFENIVLSGTWNNGACQAFTLSYVDGMYHAFSMTSSEQITVQTTGNSFYSDNICSMLTATPKVLTLMTTIGTQDSSTAVVYIKVSGSGTLQVSSATRTFGTTGYSAP